MSKQSKARCRAGQSRALPFVPLVKETFAETTKAMKSARQQIADVFRDYPLPKDEATAQLYFERDRSETKRRISTAEELLPVIAREAHLFQANPDWRNMVQNALITYIADRRRLEIMDAEGPENESATNRISRLQHEYRKAVLPLAAGYVFTPVKEQNGRDDAFALLAGLLLASVRRTPSVLRAARDAAPNTEHPMLYAALLAVAQGQADDANIGDFHVVFAEARKELNSLRSEAGAEVADSELAEDCAIDADSNPAKLLLSEFERQEVAQLHDERSQFLELLTLPQKTAISLNASGMSRREIAQRMGVGEETVKTHLAAARKHVRNWQEEGKLPRGKKS